MLKLQVIGGGKMGLALVGGLIASGWAAPRELAVVDVAEAQRSEAANRFPTVTVAAAPIEGVATVLAVKPAVAVAAAAALPAPSRVLSVAAGITTAALEAVLPAATPVIRAMPNTPALVGAGAGAVAPGANAGSDDLAWATALLGAVGVVEVVTEAQLDAVTGLSGSGPAYVFLLAEALTDAGVLAGLPRATAQRLASHTIYGAGHMLVAADADPVALRAEVTTPAGTTAAGLAELERQAWRSAVHQAVRAAAERSAGMGRT